MKTCLLFTLLLVAWSGHADYKSEVEVHLKQFESENDACYDKAADLAGQLACAKGTSASVNKYMRQMLETLKPAMTQWPRGPLAVEKLEATQKLWEKFRRDLCNYAAIAEVMTGDRAAFDGIHCGIKTTIARMREIIVVL